MVWPLIGLIAAGVAGLGMAEGNRRRQEKAYNQNANAMQESLNAQHQAHLKQQEQQAKLLETTNTARVSQEKRANDSLERTRMRTRRGRSSEGIFGGPTADVESPFSSTLG